MKTMMASDFNKKETGAHSEGRNVLIGSKGVRHLLPEWLMSESMQ